MMFLSALTLLSLSSLLNAQKQQGQQGQQQDSDGGAIYSDSVQKYKTSVAYTSLPTV